MSESILLGIISGILATAIFSVAVFCGSVVWRKIIAPWWENKLYQDARIDGKWCTELVTQDTDKDFESAYIYQTGHNVTGSITCTEGPDKGAKYKFIGCIKNQILNAYYWNERRSSTDSGSFSLRLENNGKTLRGHTAFYHDISHSILSREYVWEREFDNRGS